MRLNGINCKVFQVTDVGKPLASVSRTLDIGGANGSYVVNDQTGRRISLVEKRGTFVMKMEYVQPQADEQTDFAREGV